jgi:hypothetical protein
MQQPALNECYTIVGSCNKELHITGLKRSRLLLHAYVTKLLLLLLLPVICDSNDCTE